MFKRLLVGAIFCSSVVVSAPGISQATFSNCNAHIQANAGAVRCMNTTDPADRYRARATCRTQQYGGTFVGYAYGLAVAAGSYSTAKCNPVHVATSVLRQDIDW